MPRLESKVALVTGAGAGIGRASARALAAEGAAVMVTDIDLATAEGVVEEIVGAGGTAAARKLDIAQEGEWVDTVAATVDRFGSLSILHNNAAMVGEELTRDLDVVQMDVELWDKTMSINLRGPMLGCKHSVPAMVESGGGSIVNTGSISGLSGEIILHAYAASKAGVHSLTQCVATTYGPQGVRCNAIAPGLIWTQVTEAFWTQDEKDAWFEQHLGGRMGSPEDIAEAVVYLASDGAEHVTGQVLRIDGGFLSHYPTVPRIRALRAAAASEGS
ncbi:SDR family NAD(P)-dependent oxidoreductase [Conexibacter woesei]|uniref:Short-chain dehydrogenase/reductase SDR n=1 Tax=Conexibacter woesei (strain DSM 14684 / CCUG 47730 / CIP 108061 / JCM 11494 / NBRC 100937 / ID131577) TaxID=469383 RepID=D3F4D9_CONWI|nr:glucose 1-dehydrogenase [Conexibacter woesei]ADB50511.1 short-chain dehydrogenase/reductase SDR [Conexibacter woesei DSM 14684]